MRRRIENGERVWDALRAQGGYVYTAADGSKSVHFNKGYRPNAALVALLAAHREDLKLWVDEMHRRDDLSWRRRRDPSPLGRVLSDDKNAQNRHRQGRECCDCNGVTGSRISERGASASAGAPAAGGRDGSGDSSAGQTGGGVVAALASVALAVALGALALAVGGTGVDGPEICGARTGRFWCVSPSGGFEGMFSSFSIFGGAGRARSTQKNNRKAKS